METNITTMSLEKQAELMSELATLRKAKEDAKNRSRRYLAKNAILLEKAKAAKLTVSDKEIDDYIKAHPAK